LNASGGGKKSHLTENTMGNNVGGAMIAGWGKKGKPRHVTHTAPHGSNFKQKTSNGGPREKHSVGERNLKGNLRDAEGGESKSFQGEKKCQNLYRSGRSENQKGRGRKVTIKASS